MPGTAISHLRPAVATATASPTSEPLPCQVHPIGTFFPAGERPWTDAEDPGVYVQPRQLCASCSSRVGCLARALGQREAYGVWGGTTPSERARIHLNAILPPILRESTVSPINHPDDRPTRHPSIGA